MFGQLAYAHRWEFVAGWTFLTLWSLLALFSAAFAIVFTVDGKSMAFFMAFLTAWSLANVVNMAFELRANYRGGGR